MAKTKVLLNALLNKIFEKTPKSAFRFAGRSWYTVEERKGLRLAGIVRHKGKVVGVLYNIVENKLQGRAQVVGYVLGW